MLVPAELVGHIFSFLRGDRLALGECSKAHPMFSTLAKPYLYADIIIHTNNKRALSGLYKQLSENPYILNFPRTLKILVIPTEPKGLSIMLMMIPQMTNLVSLSIELEGQSYSFYENFLPTFRTCLRQSAIEELSLNGLVCLPLSILDDNKTVKKLTLFRCGGMASKDELISASCLSLETLIIGFCHGPNILLWATHRATSLTSLELRGSLYLNYTEFAELLKACSDSLTRLHLDIGAEYQSTYCSGQDYEGRWVDEHLAFPFTLSAHTSLVEFSISAWVCSYRTATHCALPAIIRLIKTAPSLSDVVLTFKQSQIPEPIYSFNSSPLLDRLKSDFPASVGICPLISLHIKDDHSS